MPVVSGNGGDSSFTHGAMRHLTSSITNYNGANPVAFTVANSAADADTDGYWQPDGTIKIPVGLGGLYLIQAEAYGQASGTLTFAEFQITLDTTLWNLDPLYFDLHPNAEGVNIWRSSFSVVVPMGDGCVSSMLAFWSPYRPTNTFDVWPNSYFGIWRVGATPPLP